MSVLMPKTGGKWHTFSNDAGVMCMNSKEAFSMMLSGTEGDDEPSLGDVVDQGMGILRRKHVDLRVLGCSPFGAKGLDGERCDVEYGSRDGRSHAVLFCFVNGSFTCVLHCVAPVGKFMKANDLFTTLARSIRLAGP